MNAVADRFPRHAAALKLVSGLLEPHPIELEGSLASGEPDAWSDVDLSVRMPAAQVLPYAQELIDRIRVLPQHVVSFRCDHLGLPNLIVAVLEIDRSLVKVDVKIATPDAVPIDGVPGPADGRWGSTDLLDRGVSWAFYAHTKVERGELFEAADVLQLISVRALLPLWQEHAGLPRTGARHIEQRLSQCQLALLWQLRPQRAAADELRRCLRGLVDEIDRAWQQLRDERAPSVQRLRIAIAEEAG